VTVDPQTRWQAKLDERKRAGLFRFLKIANRDSGVLNLACNDYLDLAGDERMEAAGIDALQRFGCSSSASPLVTGYGRVHEELKQSLCRWHGFPNGLIWNSGYAANQAVLSLLPQKGDLVLADRLNHNSILSGILKSGARLIRYRHTDLDHLKALLADHSEENRSIFVVTESIFSMDGDWPDLRRVAKLKERYGFFWILDEAHALGWYGDQGQGLASELGVNAEVDLLVGTMGKALGSQGAYTLFREDCVRDFLVNFSEEFIYSTYLNPVSAAIAFEAVEIIKGSELLRKRGRATSRAIRRSLTGMGFSVAEGDSSIVSIIIGDVEKTMRAGRLLESQGILAGAIRPPTVPKETSRLRLSLKATLASEDIERLLATFERVAKEVL
jgi:8-amino-7-oxononanoate synthase